MKTWRFTGELIIVECFAESLRIPLHLICSLFLVLFLVSFGGLQPQINVFLIWFSGCLARHCYQRQHGKPSGHFSSAWDCHWDCVEARSGGNNTSRLPERRAVHVSVPKVKCLKHPIGQ